MGIYIGENQLLERRNQLGSSSRNYLKGMEEEIAVGKLLAKYLPDDTYVVSHPAIGKYEPISPRYGFRLIEVKNWSLQYINSAKVNGNLFIGSKRQNPLSQTRNFIDDLTGYLQSHYKQLPDLYRSIGCLIIHYGFSSTDFKSKFRTYQREDSRADAYFQAHLFREQLTEGLDFSLMKATKYPRFSIDNLLPIYMIKKIALDFKIGDFEIKESDIELIKQQKLWKSER